MLIGDFHHRAVDLEPLGFGEFKIWDHFDFEFKAEVLAIFDFQVGHGTHGHGITDRSQPMTADGLLESLLDQSIAGFLAKFTAEAFFQQFGWGVTASEARNGGVGRQISQGISKA